MKALSRVALVSLGIVLAAAGCRSGGSGFPGPLSIEISVAPSTIAVPAGSLTTFTAAFTSTSPQGGTLTWSVIPSNGGTITNAGVYTAGSAGNYLVTATWTPSSPGVGSTISGSAKVTVAPPPQLAGSLNTDLVQASGGAQGLGGIQNAAVVGQPVPSVSSTDASHNVEVRSGFSIPVCTQAGVCQ